MPTRLSALILACSLLLLASAVRAELTPAQKAEAQALIAQFSSKEFAVRQAAVDKLAAMGPDVRPIVEKTLADTKDAEVRMRCEMVLKVLNEKFPVPKPAPPEGPEIKIDLTPSRVTLDIRDQTVAEALAALARKTGNPAFVMQDHQHRQKLSFSFKDKPYWEAVDEVLRAADKICRPTGFNAWRMYNVYDASGAKDDPRAYTGPAVVWAERTERGGRPRSVRSFRCDPSPGKVADSLPAFDKPDQLRVLLGFAAEHRNFVLESYVLYKKVAAGDGRDLTPPPPQGPAWTASPRLWGERSLMTRTTDLMFSAPDLAGGRVTVEGVLHVDYAVGKKTLKFGNVFGGEHPQAVDGPLNIAVDDVTRGGHPGEWDVKLRFDEVGKEEGVLVDGGRTDYGVALVDPKGVAHRETFGWSRTGRVIGIHFRNIPKIDDGEWSLTYTCPVRIESKEYPFVLKDVPLP